jgi:hypothetical protein
MPIWAFLHHIVIYFSTPTKLNVLAQVISGPLGTFELRPRDVSILERFGDELRVVELCRSFQSEIRRSFIEVPWR